MPDLLSEGNLALHALRRDTIRSVKVPSVREWARAQSHIPYEPVALPPLSDDDEHWGASKRDKAKQDRALVIIRQSSPSLKTDRATASAQATTTTTTTTKRPSIVSALKPRSANNAAARMLKPADDHVKPLRNAETVPTAKKENRAPPAEDPVSNTGDSQEEDEDRKRILQERKDRRRHKAVIVKDRTKSAATTGKKAAANLAQLQPTPPPAVSRKRRRADKSNSPTVESGSSVTRPRRKTAMHKANELVQEARRARNVAARRITLNPVSVDIFNKSHRSKRAIATKAAARDPVFSDACFFADLQGGQVDSTAKSDPADRSISAFFNATKPEPAMTSPKKTSESTRISSGHTAHSLQKRKRQPLSDERASAPTAHETAGKSATFNESSEHDEQHVDAAEHTEQNEEAQPGEAKESVDGPPPESTIQYKHLLDRRSSSLERLLNACEQDDLAALERIACGGGGDHGESAVATPKVSSTSIDFDKYDRILAELLS